ncbi:hypothetical protein BDR06DRAFT_1013359 [Suillus hirtellus]|nr:hypothetical protein BDR06DRAFT_1013359 [Suillus hirtellus]
MSSISLHIPAHLLPTIVSAGNSTITHQLYHLTLPPPMHWAFVALNEQIEYTTSKVTLCRPSPPHSQTSYDDDSDSDIGPQPLLAAYASQIEGKSGMEEFLEREERRRKLQEEASKLKELQQEEWMLVPPKVATYWHVRFIQHTVL